MEMHLNAKVMLLQAEGVYGIPTEQRDPEGCRKDDRYVIEL